MQTNSTNMTHDPMYPHSGSFQLSNENPSYPGANENIYLLMRGFNAIKVHGSVTNAEIMLIWDLDRRYKTELWTGADDEIDDMLAFPFKDNNGVITFEGKPTVPKNNWKANLEFQLVNLTNEEIEALGNSDS